MNLKTIGAIIMFLSVIVTAFALSSLVSEEKITNKNKVTISKDMNKTIYDFEVTSLDGSSKINFADFKGKKILIVNTASKCGYTKQYAELQTLHEKHGDKLVIIGFPANNYGKQEPGSNEEIGAFCQKNYGVTFLMAAKVSVHGDEQDPFFTWLCEQDNSDFTGKIKWNFEKFLVNENGEVIRRFRSGTSPLSEDILSEL